MILQFALDANNKKVLKIFMNLTKKGCVIKNYWQRLKLKMCKLENDITLLFVGCISLLKCEVQVIGQHTRFPLSTPKVIYDNKLESK
jgi:hypothetical protein